MISEIDPIPFQFITIPVAEYASISHPTRTVKTELSQFIINFFKIFFETGTVCLLSSHVFTALVFDSNHFGILIWKIVKPRDYNKLKAILKAFDEDF